MRTRFRNTVFLLALATCISESQVPRQQPPDDTLALVGASPITARDLFERIELMPFEEKLKDRDFESVKRKAVESLVGERLLSQLKYDQVSLDDGRNETVQSVLRDLFVRDAMFNREIRDRVTINPKEVGEGMKRYAVRRQLLVVRPPASVDAQVFASEWRRKRRAGNTNAAILSWQPFDHDTLYISFGSIDSSLEYAAYQLRDTVDVSNPVPSKLFGVVVIAMLGEEPSTEAAKYSVPDRRKAVEKILRDRKEAGLAQVFVDRVLRGQSMAADSVLFRRVTRSLWERIMSDTLERTVPGGFRYLPSDIYSLEHDYRMVRDSAIARGSFGRLRLGEFLEGLYHFDFTIPSLKPRSFMYSFFEILRAMTEAKMIALEGVRRGLQNTPEVLHDIGVWTSYWKSRNVEHSIVDTVTIRPWEPYWSFWRNNHSFVESTCVLTVQEILTPDSVTSASLFRSVEAGGDMDSLACAYSIRTAWRARGGRSGWFRFNQQPEIASRTMYMDVGETKGTVKLREGFAVLRLLGRRFEADSMYVDSLLQREQVRMRILHQQAAVNHVVARIAVNQNVEIFYDRIKTVDIENINMMTRRIIGFGGRINAAPFLVPQWQWVEEWKRLKTQLP